MNGPRPGCDRAQSARKRNTQMARSNPTYDRDPNQGPGYDSTDRTTPATIHLMTGETVTVEHYFVSEESWVCAYETYNGSFDLHVPASSIEKIERK